MNPGLGIWIAATRPAFLSVTLVGVLIGTACAVYDQTYRSWPLALVTLGFALLAHASANVLNDYYDARSGCDALNEERIAPFTGGSRLIQNGTLTERGTRNYGYLLLALVIVGGVWLIWQSGPWLLGIGLMGLFCGWAYSAPPLKLQSRGLGEITIALAWFAVVVGSDYVQTCSLNVTSMYAGLAYTPWVANVLFVNQVPDRTADAAVGKHTLIVRWTPSITVWGCLLLYGISFTFLAIGIDQDGLPIWSGLALVAAIPASFALARLHLNPVNRQALEFAIPMTILSCLLFGILLAVGLIIGG